MAGTPDSICCCEACRRQTSDISQDQPLVASTMSHQSAQIQQSMSGNSSRNVSSDIVTRTMSSGLSPAISSMTAVAFDHQKMSTSSDVAATTASNSHNTYGTAQARFSQDDNFQIETTVDGVSATYPGNANESHVAGQQSLDDSLHPAMAKLSDKIFKMSSHIDIAGGRTLRRIDQLIAQSTDKEEIKEMKQQKRLLKNRQAA